MEDCCAVCAEPRTWVAYGQCGHKEACSKCVTRLRFVMKDNRCVICQQQLLAVFVTRFMGDYTKSLGPADFELLQAEGRQSTYPFLRAAAAYFDDNGHFEEIRKLCSYTHPALAEGQADLDALPKFRSLRDLKRHLQSELSLSFCDICLEARKVFISEQLLYDKAGLARHNQLGDVEGAMAESGFNGHPMCRFCKKRFFGENELWHHMERDHERCHLCKRAHPDRFVYFKDYAELEDHFRHEHFLCGHPSCMEKKFVVFESEQELKQHNAKQHGGNMSRAERRQALTIPVNFQYRREEQEIGQGQSVRGGGGRSRTPGFRLREPDPQQVATAVQASMESASRETSQRDASSSGQAGERSGMLDEGDFPAMGPSGPAPFVPSGYGAAATGGNVPRPEEFPALPGITKAAKRRAKEKEKAAQSLAERLGRPGGIRVLHQGGNAPESSSGSNAGREAFPALGHSSSAPNLASSRHTSPAPASAQWQAQASRAPAAGPSRPPAAAEFPALQARKLPAAGMMSPPPPTRANTGSAAKASNGRQSASISGDFPVLGGARAASRERPANGEGNRLESEVPVSANGGISEGLKAANKALIEKVKLQLDAEGFTAFKQEANRYMRSELAAQDYHTTVVGLGLASLVPEMAALLPDASKRAELLSVHEQAFSSEAPQSSGRWVPPEAAAAAAGAARKSSSWQCGSCTLINGPQALRCEACGSGRPGNDMADWGGGSVIADEQQVVEELAKEAPKKKKLPKFERMRITSGGTDKAMQEELERRKTKPGNVWTQRHSMLPSAPAAPLAPNAWSNKGVAQQMKGAMKAWEKK